MIKTLFDEAATETPNTLYYIYIANERINYSDEQHHRKPTSSGDNICQDGHRDTTEFIMR